MPIHNTNNYNSTYSCPNSSLSLYPSPPFLYIPKDNVVAFKAPFTILIDHKTNQDLLLMPLESFQTIALHNTHNRHRKEEEGLQDVTARTRRQYQYKKKEYRIQRASVFIAQDLTYFKTKRNSIVNRQLSIVNSQIILIFV